jgi:hypothetical protein
LNYGAFPLFTIFITTSFSGIKNTSTDIFQVIFIGIKKARTKPGFLIII